MILGMSVKENTVFSIYDKCTNTGVIQKSKVESLVDDYIKELKIKTPNREQIAKNLSGGNQQKIVLAKIGKRNHHDQQ